MKSLLLAFALVLLCAVTPALAENKPDIDGGNVLHRGECAFNDTPMMCFLVRKGNVMYVAAHDQKGQARIYRIKEFPTNGDLEESKHLVLLWARDSV